MKNCSRAWPLAECGPAPGLSGESGTHPENAADRMRPAKITHQNWLSTCQSITLCRSRAHGQHFAGSSRGLSGLKRNSAWVTTKDGMAGFHHPATLCHHGLWIPVAERNRFSPQPHRHLGLPARTHRLPAARLPRSSRAIIASITTLESFCPLPCWADVSLPLLRYAIG